MEEQVSNMPEENTQGDISNKTIVVLVILTVLISVLGTLTVLNEVKTQADALAKVTHKTSGTAVGQVSLTISGPAPQTPKLEPTHSTGYVALTIVPTKK